MKPDLDVRMYFRGLHGVQGKCRLRIWSTPMPPVVVVSDIGGSGTSITNAAEVLASAIAQRHGLPEFTFIENYPRDSAAELGGDFERVEFSSRQGHFGGIEFFNPTWHRISVQDLYRLIDPLSSAEEESNVI
jgi:hypothetical protein